MPDKKLTHDEILKILRETPVRINALTEGIVPEQLQSAPSPGEWSSNEVLAHLRSCADVWGGCIKRIIAEDNPTIKALNPRTWISGTDYPEQEFHASLGLFSEQRLELLEVLESLSPENWSRSATVTGAGKPLIRTVQFYAQWMAVHERPHVKQIGRIVRN